MAGQFGRIAVLVCSVPALAFAGAGVAQAATNFNGVCEAGEFCLYEHVNRGGPVVDFGRACDSDYGAFPGGAMDNWASSWWNRLSGITVRIYDDSNYQGNWANLPPGSTGNLADTPVGDNAASSHRLLGTSC